MVDIGARIKEAREAKGMSKTTLAQKVGVSPTAVGNWENNGIVPRPENIPHIAAALGKHEEFLRGGTGKGGNPELVRDILENAKERIAKSAGVDVGDVQITLQIRQA